MPHLSIQAPDFHQVADANLRHCTAFLGLLLTSSARLNCHTVLSASIEPGIIWEYPGPFPVTRLRYSFFASVGLHLHATKRHYFLLCIYFWNTPLSFYDGLILYIGVLMLSADYGIRWWNTVVYFRFIVTASLSPFSGTSDFGAEIIYVKITSWDILPASHKYIFPLLCQVSRFWLSGESFGFSYLHYSDLLICLCFSCILRLISCELQIVWSLPTLMMRKYRFIRKETGDCLS